MPETEPCPDPCAILSAMTILDLATLAFAGYSAIIVAVVFSLRARASGLGVAPLYLLPYLVVADLIVRAAS
jgi:hypothetical protein